MRLLLLPALLFLSGYVLAQQDYHEEIRKWDSSRVVYLKSKNGWLNLAGLYWLKDGPNSFGSDSTNDIIFPPIGVEPKAGYFDLTEGTVRMVSTGQISVNGKPTKDALMFHPDSTNTPSAAAGSLTWMIIKREEKYGVRLRDLNHPAIAAFKGIERFPVDSSWRVKAYLDTNARQFVTINNVLGQTFAQSSPGKLRFTLQGKTYSLDALTEGDQLFIIFGDETSGITTYAAGRYIYSKWPDTNGYTTLDFNKAYNPPCAFTDHATCPLPPRQNILPLAVTAGEKSNGEGH
jgi:uncharacterized protein (DUF1684 family)